MVQLVHAALFGLFCGFPNIAALTQKILLTVENQNGRQALSSFQYLWLDYLEGRSETVGHMDAMLTFLQRSDSDTFFFIYQTDMAQVQHHGVTPAYTPIHSLKYRDMMMGSLKL